MLVQSPVRVAIVGAGAISRAHLQAIGTIGPTQIQVAGIFDQERGRAQERAREFGVQHVYPSWEALLGDVSVDVVAVLLPHDLHAQFALAALETGHHVVVEKPMATSIAECDAMLGAAASAGKRLHPVHNRVYDPATDAARAFIESGAIGPVFLAQTLGLEPPQTVSVRPWLGTKAGGGGVLLAQAIHPGYVLQTVMGDVEEVACFRGGLRVVEMTAEDTALALVRFKSGAVAEMTGTFGMRVGPHAHVVTFYGPDGFVEIGHGGVTALSESRFGDREKHQLEVEGGFGQGFRRMWEDYAEGFAAGTPTRVTGQHGKAAVELILAAYRAADERRTVHLPLT